MTPYCMARHCGLPRWYVVGAGCMLAALAVGCLVLAVAGWRRK